MPCPISGRDVFRTPKGSYFYPEPAKAVTYAKAMRDEVMERVEKGIGAVPEEKLRMLMRRH